MTILSERARFALFEILFDPDTPDTIKAGINTRLADGPRLTMLQQAIEDANNEALPLATRFTALERIIQVAQGELP